MRRILGISAYYHDAAAALLCDGAIVAAAQEERFSRRKNDERFPTRTIEFCLRHAQLSSSDLDAVVFYDKPIVKFARLLETYLSVAPAGFRTFVEVLPSWLGEKLNLRKTIAEELPGLRGDCPILFTQHHQAHAASAFFPSPFGEAAILTVDGVGELSTTTVGRGAGDRLELLQEIRFPHSLGLLYSAFTAYCGFRVNSGEYKLMGLAPYGEPRYVAAIYENLLDVKSDGSFWLNLEYFDFLRRWNMTNDKFHRLFGGPPRTPEGALETRHMDVACSIQQVTEALMVGLARQARALTGLRNLCLAGGVALNCVANGHILREKIFDQIWIQPAAGDAGGALGAALAVWHAALAKRQPSPNQSARSREERGSQPAAVDGMQGALLGPCFSDAEIESVLQGHGAVYERLQEDVLLQRTASLLAQEKIVGWVQGRMEFGPRALGNRSILGDPRSPLIQSQMNLKIKFRETFRPFAPVVRQERAKDYFELEAESPYMLLVAPVKADLRREVSDSVRGLDRLRQIRSTIPAVTHVNGTARVQTVTPEQNGLLCRLLEAFEAATGCGVLVNTSFNVRGEPIVCTPDDAYRCFMNTEMDYLVIGSCILERAAQPERTIGRTHEPMPD